MFTLSPLGCRLIGEFARLPDEVKRGILFVVPLPLKVPELVLAQIDPL